MKSLTSLHGEGRGRRHARFRSLHPDAQRNAARLLASTLADDDRARAAGSGHASPVDARTAARGNGAASATLPSPADSADGAARSDMGPDALARVDQGIEVRVAAAVCLRQHCWACSPAAPTVPLSPP